MINPGVMKTILRTGVLFASLLLAEVSGAAGEFRFSGVDRVVAISDVHGAYDAMVRTLTSAGVVDDSQSWIAGDAHLVITGDLLDRGPDSRKVMDLVMRLEEEAPEQGGRVHQLLGNHEVMNLVGDVRYVSKSEYAAFADEESAEEREAWFQVYWTTHTEQPAESIARAEFADKAPPGFFAHRRAFRPDGTYGSWLLKKPLLVVINDTAFVHGGVSPLVAELGLDGVNNRLLRELAEYTRQIAELNDAGLISPLDSFYDHPDKLKLAASGLEQPESMAAVVESVSSLNASDIHAPSGPLWYRGTVACPPLAESDRLNAALQSLGAERVVIGHTPTLTRRVLQRLDGRVVEIDTGMLTSSYRGSGNALLIQGDSLQVINEASTERLSVTPHPRRVGARDDDLSADDLQRILSHGDILSIEEDDRGREIVSFAAEGGVIQAVFSKNPGSKGFVPELAAYRLDRALSMDLVPVTVAREVDGVQGTLQFLPVNASDEVRRATSRRGASAWCPLAVQWNVMYVFDALVGNPGRPPERMLYSPDNWQLLLVGHEQSFPTSRRLPAYLTKNENVQLQVGDAWQAALTSLDDDALQAQFADVLDKRRLGALAKRRDELLKQ